MGQLASFKARLRLTRQTQKRRGVNNESYRWGGLPERITFLKKTPGCRLTGTMHPQEGRVSKEDALLQTMAGSAFSWWSEMTKGEQDALCERIATENQVSRLKCGPQKR